MMCSPTYPLVGWWKPQMAGQSSSVASRIGMGRA
jgi:hypothetical protein